MSQWLLTRQSLTVTLLLSTKKTLLTKEPLKLQTLTTADSKVSLQ